MRVLARDDKPRHRTRIVGVGEHHVTAGNEELAAAVDVDIHAPRLVGVANDVRTSGCFNDSAILDRPVPGGNRMAAARKHHTRRTAVIADSGIPVPPKAAEPETAEAVPTEE